MAIEGAEIKEQTDEIAEGGGNRFNRVVATTVALIAVFMMLCKVKDDNIVQAMMQQQALELDHWNHYQAKSIKQHIYETQVEQWKLQSEVATPYLAGGGKARIEQTIAQWEGEVKRYDGDLADLKKQAEDAHATYDALNFRDDQFDFSEALLGLAITLLAVSSLVRSRALYGLALIVSIGGVIMGLAGFLEWHIHPGVIAFLT